MDEIKSIAVPVTRRAGAKARRAGHPQIAPEAVIGGAVGEKRRPPSPVAAVPKHRYRVGQRLRFVGGGRYFGRSDGVCKVTALMPFEGGTLNYRVRSEVENFERVVAEADLTAA